MLKRSLYIRLEWYPTLSEITRIVWVLKKIQALLINPDYCGTYDRARGPGYTMVDDVFCAALSVCAPSDTTDQTRATPLFRSPALCRVITDAGVLDVRLSWLYPGGISENKNGVYHDRGIMGCITFILLELHTKMHFYHLPPAAAELSR